MKIIKLSRAPSKAKRVMRSKLIQQTYSKFLEYDALTKLETNLILQEHLNNTKFIINVNGKDVHFRVENNVEKAWFFLIDNLGILVESHETNESISFFLKKLKGFLEDSKEKYKHLILRYRKYFQYQENNDSSERILNRDSSPIALNQAAFFLLQIIKENPRLANIQHSRNGKLEAWKCMSNHEPYPWIGLFGEASNKEQVFKAWKNYGDSYNKHKKPLSLFIHIPFCSQICNYCHCIKEEYQSKSHTSSYVEQLMTDMSYFSKAVAGVPVDSIYIGGGTPSILTVTDIQRLLTHVKEQFTLTQNCLFTLEANPNSLTEKKILAANEIIPLKRVTMGVETVDPVAQKLSNRFNSTKKLEELLSILKKLKIEGVNIDLLAGLAGQTTSAFKNDIKFARFIDPTTINIYVYRPFRIAEDGYSITFDKNQVQARADQLIYGDKFLRRTGHSGLSRSFEKNKRFSDHSVLLARNEMAHMGFGVSALCSIPNEMVYEIDYGSNKVTNKFINENENFVYHTYAFPEVEEMHNFVVCNLIHGISKDDFENKFGSFSQIKTLFDWSLLSELNVVIEEDVLKIKTTSEAKIALAGYVMTSKKIRKEAEKRWAKKYDNQIDYVNSIMRIFDPEFFLDE